MEGLEYNKTSHENNSSSDIAHMSMESIGNVDFFKCNKCPYMALTAKDIQFHWQTSHTKHSFKISDTKAITVKCPGCTGVFHSEISLKTHLRNHHKMCAKDVNKLVTGLIQQFKKNQECIESMEVVIDGHPNINKQIPPLLIEVPPDPKNIVIVNNNNPPINVINIGGSTANFMINSKNQFDNSNTYIINANNSTPLTKCGESFVPNKLFGRMSKEQNKTDKNEDTNYTSSILYNKLKNNITSSVFGSTKTSYNTKSDTTINPVMNQCGKIKSINAIGDITAKPQMLTSNVLHKNTINMNNSFIFLVKDNQFISNANGKPTLSGGDVRNNVKIKQFSRNMCGVDNCSVVLSSPNNMDYHRKCHKGKELQCPECKSTDFPKVSSLHSHLWKKHKVDLELNSCEICDYKTFNKNDLTYHVLIHSDERKYSCKVCAKTFKNSKQLATHRKVHKDKIKCDICKLELKNAKLLESHKKNVHEKKKNFHCDYCSYSCATKDSLMLHIVKHSGNKFLKCTQCTFKTGDRNSLRRHKQRHSNEKRYSCKHCSYVCIQAASLKAHLTRKHADKKDDTLLSCSLCAFTTLSTNKLQMHLIAHKDVKSKTSAGKETNASESDVNKNDIIIEVTDQNSTSISDVNSEKQSSVGTVQHSQSVECLVESVPDGHHVVQKDNFNSFSNIINSLNLSGSSEGSTQTVHNDAYDMTTHNKSESGVRMRSDYIYNGAEHNVNYEMNDGVCNSAYNQNNYVPSNIDTDDNDTYFPNYESNLVINEEIPSSDNTANYNLSVADNATDGFINASNGNSQQTVNVHDEKITNKPVENVKVSSNIFVKDIVDLAASHIRTIPPNIYASDIQKKPSHTPIILINPKTQTNNRILGANIFSTNSTNSNQMLQLQSMTNNTLTQRKKPKISVKSNLILKGPDRLDSFDSNINDYSVNNPPFSLDSYNLPLDFITNNTQNAETSSMDHSSNMMTNDLYNSEHSNYLSNYLINTDFPLPNIQAPMISSNSNQMMNSNMNNIQTIPLGSNMSDISDVKIENKPYLSNQSMMSNLHSNSNMFYNVPIHVPIKFEQKMDALATFANQNNEIFDDDLRSTDNNPIVIEETPQSFENVNNCYNNNQSLYPFEDNYYFENDFITETLDGQEIIVLDDTWSDVKSVPNNFKQNNQYNPKIQIPTNLTTKDNAQAGEVSGINSNNLSSSGNIKRIGLPFDASSSKNSENESELSTDQQDVIFDLEEHYEN